MTIPYKQPWFQVLIAVILLTVVGFSVYYIGVTKGRAQAGVDFNQRQADLLLKSQIAVAEANKQKQIADSAVAYAGQLKVLAEQSTEKARATEDRITKIYEEEQNDLKKNYQKELDEIRAPKSTCAQCRDLCRRSNALTAYGPEFASAQCDATVQCADVCAGNP